MNLGEIGFADRYSVRYSICIHTSIDEDQQMEELNLLESG